jgi:presequence protease
VNNIFLDRLQSEMYQQTPYSHCSGGDPAHIPSLSHKDLVQFHATHYHPSNAKFFTYGTTFFIFYGILSNSWFNNFQTKKGDIDLQKRLKALDDRISLFHPLIPSTIPSGQPWSEPRRVQIECPPDARTLCIHFPSSNIHYIYL